MIKKDIYEPAEMEVVLFDVEDILTASEVDLGDMESDASSEVSEGGWDEPDETPQG